MQSRTYSGVPLFDHFLFSQYAFHVCSQFLGRPVSFFCLLFGNIFKIQVFWLNNRKTKYVIPCNFKFLSIKGVQDFYPKTCFFVIKMLFFKCSGFFTLWFSLSNNISIFIDEVFTLRCQIFK